MAGRLIYVTYASGPYEANLARNGWFARHGMGADKVLLYRRADLEAHPLYAANRAVFDARRGAGYWAWKPLFIAEALKQAGPDDLVIYHDCGTGLRYKTVLYPRRLIALARKAGYLTGIRNDQFGKNRAWNRRRCLELMGLDSEQARDAAPVEAVISLWSASAESRAFVEAWRDWCLNLDAIRDDSEEEKTGEDPAFIEHRYDQAILTNLTELRRAPSLEVSREMLPFAKSITMIEIELRARESRFWRLVRGVLLRGASLRRRLRG